MGAYRDVQSDDTPGGSARLQSRVFASDVEALPSLGLSEFLRSVLTNAHVLTEGGAHSMWYEEPRWRNRLVVEHAAMESRFPDFVLIRSPDRLLVWRGILRPAGRLFEVSATMPRRYPYQEPELRLESPACRSDAPHRYLSGAMCIHPAGGWDPTRGTIASTIPLAAAWLVRYMSWLDTGVF